MPIYDAAYYADPNDDERMDEMLGYEAESMIDAMFFAMEHLKDMRGNAHVKCVMIEEVVEGGIDEDDDPSC